MDDIVSRLREETRRRGDFRRLHVCLGSTDIPDEHEGRLVILGPEYPHAKGQADSAARTEAQNILDHRGNSPRNYKNTLVFLACDATRLKELQSAIRHALAWKSILDEREQLDLDPIQSNPPNRRPRAGQALLRIRLTRRATARASTPRIVV